MYNNHFNNAKDSFEKYQDENGDPNSKYYKLAASQIASCQFALNPINRDMETLVSEGLGYLN